MAATSDDRNGVVVNRARRVQVDRLNKRHSDSSGRGEVHRVRKFVRKVKQCFYHAVLVPVRPKSGFLRISTAIASTEHWSSGSILRSKRSQPISLTVTTSRKSQSKANRHCADKPTTRMKKFDCTRHRQSSSVERIVTSRWHWSLGKGYKCPSRPL